MNGALDRGLEQKVLIGLLFTVALVLLTAVYFLTEPRRLAAAEQRFLERSQRWGAELYLLNCAPCHGEQGQGLVGPALRDSQLDEDAIVHVISRGRPGTAMPAFAREEGGALTSYQVHDLARLVRHWSDDALEQAKRHHEEEKARLATPAPQPSPTPVAAATPPPSPSPPPGASPIPAPTPSPSPRPTLGASPTPAPTPPADIERGKALFLSQGCGACHAVAGVATGTVGPNLSKIGSAAATRQFGVAAADYLRESLLNPGASLVPGFAPIMPSYQGRLSPEDLTALMEFMLSLR